MIKEVREFYGIPQNLLADFLGITRSHLSMAEGGRRGLPGESSLRLLKFYKAISQSQSLTDEGLKTSVKEQNEKRKKIIKDELIICRFQVKSFERSLKKLQEQQSKALKIFSSLSTLTESAEPFDIGMIKIIEHNARILQKKTGLDKQLAIEFKIKALQATIGHLEKL